jgi:hypothetical protein
MSFFNVTPCNFKSYLQNEGMFLKNVHTHLPNYSASHSRRIQVGNSAVLQLLKHYLFISTGKLISTPLMVFPDMYT